ncbi:MAG: ATP-binding cassette domain-containing protein [Pseudomonadota bacterium]
MILRVNNLSIRHGDEVYLRGLNFDVDERDCVVIRSQVLLLGTSLLHGLLGIGDELGGEVRFEGENLASNLPLPRLLDLRQQFGYVHRVGGLISLLDVKENIVLPLCYHAHVDREEVWSAVDQVATALDIRELLDRDVDSLDTVQTRLVNLARALAGRPRILLVDAILEGMEENQKLRVTRTINKFREKFGLGVIMTTRVQHFPNATQIYDLQDDGLHRVPL